MGVSMHYEVELGLIIGKTLRDLDPNDEKAALDAIDCMRTVFFFYACQLRLFADFDH